LPVLIILTGGLSVKSRLIYIAVFGLGFITAFTIRTGVEALKVQQYGQKKYGEGKTAGVEQVRAEAVREGHARYFDTNRDMVSDFEWNKGRVDWNGGMEDVEGGRVKELSPVVKKLIQ
jgi:hypothetical protein